MLNRVFDQIEREFGSAFWTMRETSLLLPPIISVQTEDDLLSQSIRLGVRFTDAPMLALNIHAQEFRNLSPAMMRDVMREFDRRIQRIHARVQSGYLLYQRWLDVGDRMIEHYEIDPHSIMADLAAGECDRLERLADERFREARQKIAEATHQKQRFRVVFAACIQRSRLMFEPPPAPEPLASPRRDVPDYYYTLTATEVLMRQHQAEAHAFRRRVEQQQMMAIYGGEVSGFAGGGGGVSLLGQQAGSYIAGIGGRGGGGGGYVFLGIDLANPYVNRSGAEERAWDLLLEHLTDSQRRDLEQHGHFHVVGGRTGSTYRIRRGTTVNVDLLEHRGRVLDRLCFQPQGAPTIGDTMLAQKIMLELDEDAALAAAIRHGGDLWARESAIADRSERMTPTVWQSLFGRSTA